MTSRTYTVTRGRAETIFWVGFGFGLAWGFALGATFVWWVSA